MTSTNPARPRSRPWRHGSALRLWWRSRPASAGMSLLLAAVALIWPPYASLQLGPMSIAMQTLGGSAALMLGLGLAVCGLVLWSGGLRRWPRVLVGCAAGIAACAALAAANLGSFFIGTGFGLLGAALAISWTEDPAPDAPAADPAREPVESAEQAA